MRTRILMLAAVATAVGFTACQNANVEGGYTQEQLDSVVQFKVDSATNALRMENDSLINIMAMDAAAAPDANTSTSRPKAPGRTTSPTTKSPTQHQATEPAPTRQPQTIGDGKPKAGNQDPNTIGSGKPKAGNQDQNTIGDGKPKAGNR